MMGTNPFGITITVIAILAAGFILIGIFYRFMANRLGVEEDTPGARFLSVAIGLMLFALLLVYRLARDGMAVV